MTNKNLKQAYFAGGCFWGIEHLMQHLEAVKEAISGYMGGVKQNPTYREVLFENTKHLETVKVIYDSSKMSYENLSKFFFEIHDFSQTNGQGPDIGDQYLSAVFYNNDEEKYILQNLIDILKNKGYAVTTRLIPATKHTFWEAEDFNQDYYQRMLKEPYCHYYQKKF